MGIESAYVAPLSEVVKQKVNKPVIVTGRINQPQEAEQILSKGQADLCGMTRAMICDAQLPVKAKQGQVDAIRACIACNQSCIGRAHKGVGISCLQNPVSGRELELGQLKALERKKHVLIIGGGPAGMKAAVTCAQRGHRVSLFERSRQLGGQVLLAQRLPGREEFGGLITNLEYELAQVGVDINYGVEVTTELIQQSNADHVILATGGQCHRPDLPMLDESMVASYQQVLLDEIKPGNRVVVADWRGDWIGLGLAERLARQGCQVSLYTNAGMAGETLQIYTRNHYLGRLYKLGVEMVMHARLYGAEAGSVFFQNSVSDEPVIVDDVDTLVYSMGARSNNTLEQSLNESGINFTAIGDCVVPRSAEEAIYEALMAANEIT